MKPEEIEREKAKLRILTTQNNDAGRAAKENFPELAKGQTRDKVAEKIGIGSGKQYEKAKKESQ